MTKSSVPFSGDYDLSATSMLSLIFSTIRSSTSLIFTT